MIARKGRSGHTAMQAMARPVRAAIRGADG
ncbi:hypothetical protein AvCA_05200 [Azotobacter vinelandii CA]|uniref:Uncharacterized protein n=2 Tax=Azotobacter vinelandii TaxID=354 RepID=C1DJI8_AZOVD|nr:hypothetical protein Avin_05200 [Azotobacter vinelandii DJ]AGK17269.1 hypothetical protein AvCA_05200 [Azotobacter vinelandii CA]AGK19355.1 hypothetical protein AvCA6_05200 [Azotobacter vinelandii CA6]